MISPFPSKVQQCRNWAEYRELLAGREGRRKGRQEHLWNREVTPLHDPRQGVPTSEITWHLSLKSTAKLLKYVLDLTQWI